MKMMVEVGGGGGGWGLMGGWVGGRELPQGLPGNPRSSGPSPVGRGNIKLTGRR